MKPINQPQCPTFLEAGPAGRNDRVARGVVLIEERVTVAGAARVGGALGVGHTLPEGRARGARGQHRLARAPVVEEVLVAVTQAAVVGGAFGVLDTLTQTSARLACRWDTHTHTQTQTHTHVNTRTHTHTHSHTYTHKHTRKHIHTQREKQRDFLFVASGSRR